MTGAFTNTAVRGGRFRDLSGLVFGGLKVVDVSHKKATKYYWRCLCECGTEVVVRGEHLKQGQRVSCGCRKLMASHLNGTSNKRHGESSSGGRKRPSPEYRTWKGIKHRCLNPRHKSFAYYGGRGIRVCDRWAASFEAFLDDVGRKPSPQHSIDRIDVNGNYEPGNVRWATATEQEANKRAKAKVAHPDAGGSDGAMQELIRARDEAMREAGP